MVFNMMASAVIGFNTGDPCTDGYANRGTCVALDQYFHSSECRSQNGWISLTCGDVLNVLFYHLDVSDV
jgi:hypothetical protein